MDFSRVSVCTYAVRDRELEPALDLIRDAGFRKLDLWGRPPHFSVDPAECDHDALEAALAQRGMEIANLGTYSGAAFASESVPEREAGLADLKQAVDLAVRFGARSIRVNPGRPEDASLLDRIAPYFRLGAEYAEEKSVYLGIECHNHGAAISGNPEVLLELSQKVGSRYFGVIYEPVNLMSGGVDYKEGFETLRDYVVHVHLKDGAHFDGQWAYAMLGEGEIDLHWVIDSLDDIGYQGTYALEYEAHNMKYPVPPETGLKKWHEVWERL